MAPAPIAFVVVVIADVVVVVIVVAATAFSPPRVDVIVATDATFYVAALSVALAVV